jgi:hypothetical protein
MWFFFSFLPATIWVVLGYFILFSSTKAEGGVQLFGRLLAVWVLIIAALFPLIGAYVTLSGFSPHAAMMGPG